MEDNSCRIYETRPDICRVNIESHKKNNTFLGRGALYSTEKELFEASARACEKLILEDGLDKRYIPTLGEIIYEANKVSNQST